MANNSVNLPPRDLSSYSVVDGKVSLENEGAVGTTGHHDGLGELGVEHFRSVVLGLVIAGVGLVAVLVGPGAVTLVADRVAVAENVRVDAHDGGALVHVGNLAEAQGALGVHTAVDLVENWG